MKKLTMLASLILGVFLLAGCANDPQKPTDNTPQPTSTMKIEKSELDMLRSAIDNGNCMLGVGFFGYIDSESDEKAMREYIAESAIANKYPFLLDCTTVLTEGAELYAFVPANDAIAITVYRADISEDGDYIDNKDAPLYIGKPGEPVVLRCNISEIYANVLVSLTDGTQIKEFRPMISLKDGRMVQEPDCYDFSVYSDNDEKAIEDAQMLLAANDDVQKALERGMKLLYTGDTQSIDGKSCLVFALGTDRDEQFVRERYYAVAGENIYAYFPETDQWQQLK